MAEKIIQPNEYEIEFRIRRLQNGQYGLVCTECERAKATTKYVWQLRSWAAVLTMMKTHRTEHFGNLSIS